MVLAEAISVIVRVKRITNKLAGGWDGFLRLVPNQTLCSDDELARVGFMTPQDIRTFIDALEARGLRFVENGRAVDLCVVDQRQGPTCECDWLEFRYLTVFEGNYTIAVCRLASSHQSRVAIPAGWQYEGSLSQRAGFVPNEEVASRLHFLRHEKEMDVYLDHATGKEMFVGRTSPHKDG